MVWAYIGPEPAPELWDWDRYYDRGYKQIVFSTIPCNWLQCQENSIDPVHFEWMHSNWSLRQSGKDESSPSHVKVGFKEFEFGFTYHRVREDTDEQDELWTVGRVCLWPNALYTGHFEWRVPIDDDHTLSVGWFVDGLPGDKPFEQDRIPYWYAPVRDEASGRWVTSHIMNQDFVAWVGQGAMTDRWNEHLGESDRGVIMVRRRFMEDIKTVQDGGDPKGIVRDAARNAKRLHLPISSRPPRPVQDDPHPFPFLIGQPPEIWDEMLAVWAEHRG
jgi:5,5'-dehydrodivanillate O-demethylase